MTAVLMRLILCLDGEGGAFQLSSCPVSQLSSGLGKSGEGFCIPEGICGI
jgi:hypothetical protein